MFVAIFFVASEAAETFFTDAIGPYAGLVAAGLLVLAIAPLERLGRKVASGVVDEPVDEEEYEKYRKLEVYRATYEEVTADEQLSERDRRTLDAMAANLGLSEEERRFVEEQVGQERASGEREAAGAVPASPGVTGEKRAEPRTRGGTEQRGGWCGERCRGAWW